MKIIKEKTRSELACISRIYTKRGPQSAFHWHEKVEVCFIKHGEFTFFSDGEYIDASSGDIVVFGEHSVHKFIPKQKVNAITICQFPISIMLSSGIKVTPLKMHISAEEIKTVPDLDDNLTQLFRMLRKQRRSEKSVDNPFFRSLCASLYFLLMKHFPANDSSTVNKRQRQEFYRIAEYINSHFTEDINVSSIADALCIARGTASEIFSKYAEVSISSYINSLRINHSNKLLESGSTISNAAFESGFSSLRTFNYAYKRETGITPTEYLKKTKKIEISNH